MTDKQVKTTSFSDVNHYGLVVGMSGVTNGGKTELCQQLQKSVPNCTVLPMDNYYRDDEDPHHILAEGFNGHKNWEALESIHLDVLIKDVRSWQSKNLCTSNMCPVLLVDGIIIFNDRNLEKYFDRKFFLYLTKEECWQRRKDRVYEPPDPDGYFDKIVWPMYEKNKQKLIDQNDIVYLDGSLPFQSLLDFLIEDITKLQHKKMTLVNS